jgi:hypothetical protein
MGCKRMSRFTLGQVVRIKNPSDLGIILAECKEPEGHWCVALRTKEDNSIVAVYVKETEIESYKRHCWNSGCHSNVDSEIHKTCSSCGWVICPNCGVCKEGGCEPFGLTIRKTKPIGKLKAKIIKVKPKNKVNSDCDLDDFLSNSFDEYGLDKRFWDSIDNMLEK